MQIRNDLTPAQHRRTIRFMKWTKFKERMEGARAERDARIVSMHKQGKSLAQIAQAEGLTRQRVHQILKATELA